MSYPEFVVPVGALIVALLMLAGGGYLVYRNSKPGWSSYTLQAFGLVMFVPTVFLLAVYGLLSKEIIATLLGGIAGYIFGRGGSSAKD
ncbi:MAG: hypothetical protein Q8P46_02035 [Hyphomicrobiales bacterium]|nr:hypothetical protein [Hyphomicrobiales bacterium]